MEKTEFFKRVNKDKKGIKLTTINDIEKYIGYTITIKRNFTFKSLDRFRNGDELYNIVSVDVNKRTVEIINIKSKKIDHVDAYEIYLITNDIFKIFDSIKNEFKIKPKLIDKQQLALVDTRDEDIEDLPDNVNIWYNYNKVMVRNKQYCYVHILASKLPLTISLFRMPLYEKDLELYESIKFKVLNEILPNFEDHV